MTSVLLQGPHSDLITSPTNVDKYDKSQYFPLIGVSWKPFTSSGRRNVLTSDSGSLFQAIWFERAYRVRQATAFTVPLIPILRSLVLRPLMQAKQTATQQHIAGSLVICFPAPAALPGDRRTQRGEKCNGAPASCPS